MLLKIHVFRQQENHATGPWWGPDCQLRGWLIRTDNDVCPCPPPRTRVAATLNGRRWGQKAWEERRWRLKSYRESRQLEMEEEEEEERRNSRISSGEERTP